MKAFTFALVLLAAVLMANAFRDRGRLTPTRPGGSGFPRFPGQGPFNPSLRLPDAYIRHRRANEVDSSLVEDSYSNEEESSLEPESDPRLALRHFRALENGDDSFRFEEETPEQHLEVLDEGYIFNPQSPMPRRYLKADVERQA